MKKKLFPTVLALVCAFCCMFSLVACDNGDNAQTVAVTGITLNKAELVLEIDGEETLTATVTPENATNKAVTWTSDKPDVASVDNGKVTAKAAGTAVITAQAGDKTANCTVTVNATTPSIVLTENTDYSALEGEKVTEAEWRAAFAKSTYLNVTIKNVSLDEEIPRVLYWKKVNEQFIAGYRGTEFENAIYPKNDKLYLILPAQAFGEEDGYVGIEYENVEDADYQLNYTIACPDFSEFFDTFQYDETLKAYTFDHKTVHTNSTYENWDIDWEYAVVKIINGKLAYVNVGNFGKDKNNVEYKNDQEDIFFYDFGTTEITVPEFTEVDPSEL